MPNWDGIFFFSSFENDFETFNFFVRTSFEYITRCFYILEGSGSLFFPR